MKQFVDLITGNPNLTLHGYAVLVADDLDEGVKIVENGLGQLISMVLLDLNKSIEHGFRALSRIQRAVPKLPVMLTTAYTREYAQLFGNINSLELLSKPFSITDLRDRVRATLFGRTQESVVACAA
jgi:DNA-binding response OmpR family regulator